MTLKLYGDGEITGATSIESPTILSGLTIPTTGFGKILQIVRATDATARTTTSTSFVDVTGMSVTITPQKVDSIILVSALFLGASARSSTGDGRILFSITTSGNTALSGTEDMRVGLSSTATAFTTPISMTGYSAPATLSAVTYKLRFAINAAGTDANVLNATSTGQMYAIEVSA